MKGITLEQLLQILYPEADVKVHLGVPAEPYLVSGEATSLNATLSKECLQQIVYRVEPNYDDYCIYVWTQAYSETVIRFDMEREK